MQRENANSSCCALELPAPELVPEVPELPVEDPQPQSPRPATRAVHSVGRLRINFFTARDPGASLQKTIG